MFCYMSYSRRQYNRGQWWSGLVSFDWDFFDYGGFAPENRVTPGPAAGLARREFGGPVAGVQWTFVGAPVSRRIDKSPGSPVESFGGDRVFAWPRRQTAMAKRVRARNNAQRACHNDNNRRSIGTVDRRRAKTVIKTYFSIVKRRVSSTGWARVGQRILEATERASTPTGRQHIINHDVQFLSFEICNFIKLESCYVQVLKIQVSFLV